MLRVGRNREKHNRMPTGWAPSASGAIYFRPTNEQDRRIVRAISGGPLSLLLGRTHDEAAETYAKLIVAARRREESIEPGTIGEIVARARQDFLPAVASPKTREERERHLDELERLFGSRRYARNVYEASRDPKYLRALDIQQHVDLCRQSRPVAVNRAVRTWELVFADARRRWGLTEYNPCSGISLNTEQARDVLPTDKQIFGCDGPYRKLTAPGRFIVAMYRFYGRRKGETLKLQLSSAQEDGVHMRRGKARGGRPGKEIIIRWDPRLRRMWERVLRWRVEYRREGKVESTMLLLNQRGRPYTEGTFNCDWRRAMKASKYRTMFTAHDIRATRASSLEREQAVHVLAHDNPATTAKVYRRGPLVIDMRDEANSRKASGNSRKK